MFMSCKKDPNYYNCPKVTKMERETFDYFGRPRFNYYLITDNKYKYEVGYFRYHFTKVGETYCP